MIIEHLDDDFISWSCVKSMSALDLIAEMNTLMHLQLLTGLLGKRTGDAVHCIVFLTALILCGL